MQRFGPSEANLEVDQLVKFRSGLMERTVHHARWEMGISKVVLHSAIASRD